VVQSAHAAALVADVWSVNDELGGEQGGHLSPSKQARSASMAVTAAVLQSEQFAAAAQTVVVASDGTAEELQSTLDTLRSAGRAVDLTAAVSELSTQLTGRRYSAHCRHGGVFLVLSPSKQHCYLLYLSIHWSAPLLANGDFAWEGLPAAVQFARAQGPLWVAVCLTRLLKGWQPALFEGTACSVPSLQGKGLAQFYRSMTGAWGGECLFVLSCLVTLMQ
jgi:hypothetical protein